MVNIFPQYGKWRAKEAFQCELKPSNPFVVLLFVLKPLWLCDNLCYAPGRNRWIDLPVYPFCLWKYVVDSFSKQIKWTLRAWSLILLKTITSINYALIQRFSLPSKKKTHGACLIVSPSLVGKFSNSITYCIAKRIREENNKFPTFGVSIEICWK